MRDNSWPNGDKWAAILLVTLLFLLIKADKVMSYEREVVLSEEYQTRREKEVIEDRFRLDLGWTYGMTTSTESSIITGWYDLDPAFAYYLDRLGLEYSSNFLSMRATATYLISSRLGISTTVPFGVVEPKRERDGIFPNYDSEYEFGIGDISGGINYCLVPETERIPNVVVGLDLNSNTSKYTSLGNGVWDIAGGLQVRKLLSESFYVLGLSDYTYTMEEKGVNPGDVIGYGGGIGFLLGKGNIAEVRLKKYDIGESEIGGRKWLPENDSLLLTLSLRTNVGSMNVFLAGFEEGFHHERTLFGIEYVFPFK
ncbi:MAG: hypothetical protein ACYSUY_03095 [Planctomycetota bacterium]|jgi:hypothetical protein